MTVRITPALGYAHGHIETLLIQLGINPPTPRRADGLVIMDLSEAQLAAFQLKGNAHRIERLPDAPVEATAAPQAPVIEMPKPPSDLVTMACPICNQEFHIVRAMAPDGNAEVVCSQCNAKLTVEHFTVTGTRPTSVETPTLQQVKEAGYSDEAAKGIVARQEKLAQWVKDGNTIESFSE